MGNASAVSTGREKSREIDRTIEYDRINSRKDQKLLLLGEN